MQWTLVCAHRDVETNYWSHHKQEWITTNEYSITCNTQWKVLVGFQLKILSHNAAYTSLCLPVLLLEIIMSNFLELKRYTPLINLHCTNSQQEQQLTRALWVGYNYCISMTACASPIFTIFGQHSCENYYPMSTGENLHQSSLTSIRSSTFPANSLDQFWSYMHSNRSSSAGTALVLVSDVHNASWLHHPPSLIACRMQIWWGTVRDILLHMWQQVDGQRLDTWGGPVKLTFLCWPTSGILNEWEWCCLADAPVSSPQTDITRPWDPSSPPPHVYPLSGSVYPTSCKQPSLPGLPSQ